MRKRRHHRRWAKIAAVLVVAAVLVSAQQFGIFGHFADPAGVKSTLVELGPWGYVAFLAAYAILQPFGFPATVFTLAAPLIWSWPVAFVLSLGGAMAASVLGFMFARFVARDWVAARIPARLRRHDDALGRRAFLTVLLLRSVFWMASPLHAFFGVSQVKFWTHLAGSLLAYIPPLLLISYFGERLFEALWAAPRALWIGLGLGLVAVVLTVGAIRRLRRVRRARSILSFRGRPTQLQPVPPSQPAPPSQPVPPSQPAPPPAPPDLAGPADEPPPHRT